MPNIEVLFGRSWGVKVPEVIRYTDAKWVRDFFQTGSIQLTTYQYCREHEDLTRRDDREGSASYAFKNGDSWFAGRHYSGDTSYMLCGSLLESERLVRHFGCDAYFVIHDPIQFADAISRWVPGFVRGLMGPCRYRQDRSVQRPTNHQLVPSGIFNFNPSSPPTQAELEATMEKLKQGTSQAVNAALEHDSYFCKDELFAHELEFRMAWTVPHAVKDRLVVSCPEAIKFCSTNVPIDHPYKPPPHPGRTGVVIGGGSASSPGPEGEGSDPAPQR